MSKAIKFVLAYLVWTVDLVLALWLAFLGRTGMISFLALFYKPNDFAYANLAKFIDKAFTIVLGLGWLIFMILSENYFRKSAHKDAFSQSLARVSGPLILTIFLIDLLLFWLQGVDALDWSRWLILVGELAIGLALTLFAKRPLHTQPT